MDAKKTWSPCKKAVCCGCSCCCMVFIALGITGGVLYAAYEDQPSVDITNATLKNIAFKTDALNVPNEVQASWDITVRVGNPNRSPLGATVKDVKTTAYSLDRRSSDKIGKPLLLAYANIDGKTKIEPESVTNLILTAIMTSDAGKDPEVVRRFSRDCSPAGDLTTKMRVHIEQLIADVFGFDVKITDIDVDFELPCKVSLSPPSSSPSPPSPQSPAPQPPQLR